jgi:hypothetical protein
VNGKDVHLRQPLLLEGGTPRIPFREIAEALGYFATPLSREKIHLVSPQGETAWISLSSPDPSLVITTEELERYFHVTARYDAGTQVLRVDAVPVDREPFRTRYPIPHER